MGQSFWAGKLRQDKEYFSICVSFWQFGRYASASDSWAAMRWFLAVGPRCVVFWQLNRNALASGSWAAMHRLLAVDHCTEMQ